MSNGDTLDTLQSFWSVRDQQQAKALAAGHQGSAARQAGHLGAFEDLVVGMWKNAGIESEDIRTGNARIPGHFREVKNWDIAALDHGSLVGAVEFKSQVGSIGKNQNNRLEEVLGSGYDARSAQEVSSLFGDTGVWLGYVFILGGHEDVHRPVRGTPAVVNVDPEFKNASYVDRYSIAIRRMLDRGLYDACWFLVTHVDEDQGVLFQEPVPEASRAVFQERLESRAREIKLMRQAK